MGGWILLIERILLLAFVFGLLEACFGAWKDTLFEPFEIRKFFRSPIIVSIWAALIYYFSDVFIYALAALAMERLTVEGWKALIRKPPGKFQNGEQKDTHWLLKRLS